MEFDVFFHCCSTRRNISFDCTLLNVNGAQLTFKRPSTFSIGGVVVVVRFGDRKVVKTYRIKEIIKAKCRVYKQRQLKYSIFSSSFFSRSFSVLCTSRIVFYCLKVLLIICRVCFFLIIILLLDLMRRVHTLADVLALVTMNYHRKLYSSFLLHYDRLRQLVCLCIQNKV